MNPFEATVDLLGRIEATDASGVVVDLSEGLARASDLFVERAQAGAQFMFVGNGASQSIASHIAADFLKNGHMKAIAFTDSSILTCVGNDLGYENIFAEPIGVLGAEGDMLVAISSSGCSPNVLKAVATARDRGMSVITVSGFKAGNPLRLSVRAFGRQLTNGD